MKQFLSLLALYVVLLAACAGAETAVPTPIPTAVAISGAAGETLATQEGPLWVLLSGVDEHGLIAEHELTLLLEPEAPSNSGPVVHTGIAAAVLEIRHGGPQNLQRFYRVETVNGDTGWISDYYVRRVAYLYDASSETIPLLAAPDGQEVARLPNISPVAVKAPADDAWWLVQAVEDGTLGWVRSELVKESPLAEFLQNQSHDHP
ncbi:MAG: SH3 domain-containing protein [Anaerolineaceae bacterium]|nr:SH3 domain-containing protein [Anaerolineaceae bacterium]